MKTLLQVIKKAKSDFYSSTSETQRIAQAAGIQLTEALLPLSESGSEDLRTIARQIHQRFWDGECMTKEAIEVKQAAPFPPGSYL